MDAKGDVPAHVWVALAEQLKAIWAEAYAAGEQHGREIERRRLRPVPNCPDQACPLTTA